MTGGPVQLHALVTEGERPIVRSAAALLSAEIAKAGAPFDLRCAFPRSLDDVGADGPAIVVASLLAEAEDVSEAWPAVAARLRASYGQAALRGDLRLFVCTVLRHAGPGGSPEDRQARRIRIRRLNLLAADLSRETGLQVIDLDRALSDVGARALRTDFRLEGMLAGQAAARCIALTLLSAGLDEHAPYEAQEAARAAIEGLAEPWRDAEGPTHEMVRGNLIALGRGRGRQRVSAVVDATPGGHAGWLLRGVMTRRISLPDAFERLGAAIAKRGVRGSLALLLAGLRTLVRQGARPEPRAP